MRIKVSGGRGDLTEWPDAGVPFDVGDEEGAQLCAGGLAYPVAEFRAEVPLEAAIGGSILGAEEDDRGLTVTIALPPSAAAETPPAKPIVNSPKAVWVDYAVGLGADRAGAEGSTKADLINWVKDREG
jgi:hypothetical protein